jgi:hypothetical protein
MWDKTDTMLKFVSCCNTPVFTATAAAIEFPVEWFPCIPVDQFPVLMEYAMYFVMVCDSKYPTMAD